MSRRKPFEELTIQDDFMFCKVMQDVNICKRVLQLVLGEEIPKIVSISSQETIENHSELKSVRLDVLAKDEKVKNIELRNLLKYICDGIPTDSLTEEIDMSIAKIKQNLAYIEEYKSFSARMQDEREEGRKEGIQTGSEQRNIYLAKSFRDMGFPLDKIAQATGLTQAEIQKL